MADCRSNGRKRSRAGDFASAASLAVLAAAFGSPDAASAQTSGASSGPVEEVVVTGSRIARPETELPTPVSVVSADTLRRAGTDSLGAVLAQQPALSFSGSPQAQQQQGAAGTRGEFSGGLALADLRGLGANRTLTLVNGRRFVGSDPGSVAVDLNAINPVLISRIEVITGGASAVYGSDAVSGVVNIVTKDKYEGAEFEIRGSSPKDGGYGSTFRTSALLGQNFAGGRGNVTLSAEYDRQNRVKPSDVPERGNYGLVVNPANTRTGDGIPDALLVNNYYGDYASYNGVIGVNGDTRGLGIYTFDSNGKPVRSPTRTYNGVSSLFGGFSSAAGCPGCFALSDWYEDTPPMTRETVNLQGHYDLTDNITAYAEFQYAHRDSLGLGQPPARTADPINVRDNAFLDNTLRAQLLAAGATSIALGSTMLDFPRSSEVVRDTWRVVGGVRGKFDTSVAPLSWDASYVYGQTDVRYLGYNRVYLANYLAALDSVVDPADGQIKCRVNVPSMQPAGYVKPVIQGGRTCAPFNPFGAGRASQASTDFMRVTTDSNAYLNQAVASGILKTDSSKLLTLPGGGIINVVAGVEYRQENAGARWDPALKSAVTTQIGTQTDYDAGFYVKEYFGEVAVPLLTKLPFAETLSFEAATRSADYSFAGHAEATKFGVTWGPLPDIRFRATTGRAVRAPNITEGFQPSQLATSTITDPCAPNVITANVNRAANCAALGRPANYVVTTGAVGQPIATSGNPNLVPEKSTSYTIGTVITPSFLPGFSASIDAYRIKIRDAITLVTAQTIANNCVDSSNGPNAAFCNLISRVTDRAAANYFNINGGRTTYVNAARLTTRGYDVQARYTRPLFDGYVTATLSATYLKDLRSFPFQDNPTQYTLIAGQLGYPKRKGQATVSYDLDAWTFTWTGRYVGSQDLVDRSPGTNPEVQDLLKTPSEFYNDLYVEYRTPFRGTDLTAYVGATNVLNVRPPIIGATQGSAGSVYDELGPVLFAGLRVKF